MILSQATAVGWPFWKGPVRATRRPARYRALRCLGWGAPGSARAPRPAPRLRGAGWRRTPARLCPLTVVRHPPVSVGGHTLQRTPLASSTRQAAPRGYGGGRPRRRCSANADRGPVGRRDQPVPSDKTRARPQARSWTGSAFTPAGRSSIDEFIFMYFNNNLGDRLDR